MLARAPIQIGSGASKSGIGTSLDKVDRFLNRRDLLGIVIRNFRLELFLERRQRQIDDAAVDGAQEYSDTDGDEHEPSTTVVNPRRRRGRGWGGHGGGTLADRTGCHDTAIAAFHKVFTFPKSNKNPDAQFKLGLCYVRKGDSPKAREEFQRLLDLYPNSDYSKRAQSHLTSW